MSDPIDYIDLAAIDDTLKYVYGDLIKNQFHDETTTYHQFSKSDRTPKGLGYQFGVRYARGQGVGGALESGRLPDPIVGKFDKGKIKPAFIYGSIRLTGPAIYAGKGDVAAFVDTLADSVDDIYQSIVVDLNRMSCGDSHGKLATLSATSDTLSTTVAWTGTFDDKLGVSRCIPGMIVDFDEAGTVDVTSAGSRISSIDPVTNIITFEKNDGAYNATHPLGASYQGTQSAATIASGAVMVRIGARAASWTTAAVPREIMGLEGIYDDDTLLAAFEDIDSGVYPDWQGNVLGNSSVDRPLTLKLMLQCLALTRVKSGRKVNIIRMATGQQRAYADLLIPDIRFAPTKLEGGYETLTFQGGDGSVKMVIDPAIAPGKIFFEPDGAIQKYEMAPLGWGNIDPGMHQRAGYDEYDRFLRIFTQLGTEQRNCLTLLTDLTEPNLYE
jgi:hypothetical protein